MGWIVKATTIGGYVITDDAAVARHVPPDPANRHYQEIQRRAALPVEDPEHIDILPADPPPPPPTTDQKIDRAGEIFLAFLKAYAQREGLTLAQVRDAIKANL